MIRRALPARQENEQMEPKKKSFEQRVAEEVRRQLHGNPDAVVDEIVGSGNYRTQPTKTTLSNLIEEKQNSDYRGRVENAGARLAQNPNDYLGNGAADKLAKDFKIGSYDAMLLLGHKR
jgi:hypothetical protein